MDQEQREPLLEEHDSPLPLLWTSILCGAFSNIHNLLLPPFLPRARIGLGVMVVLLTFLASAAHLRSFWRSGVDRRMVVREGASIHIMRLLMDQEEQDSTITPQVRESRGLRTRVKRHREFWRDDEFSI
jgi:hypothetical protein